MVCEGEIMTLTFRNEDTGYSVMRLTNNVVVVGCIPFVSIGSEYKFYGSYIKHAKHGEQFEFTSCEMQTPDTEKRITAFIGSGLIEGVGPATAKKIVTRFGKNTLNIMECEPQKLALVRGISQNKAEKIGSSYKQIRDMQSTVLYLAKFKISLNMAVKIFKYYGEAAIELVTKNPYRLIETIDGIGFLTADEMAKTFGIGYTSTFRVRAGIVYSLRQSAESDGNTYLPLDELSKQTCRLLRIKMEELVPVFNVIINELCLDRVVVSVDIDGQSGIMLNKFFYAERSIAQRIHLLQSADTFSYSGDFAKIISHYEHINKITLHKTQKEAIQMALNNNFSVITGGPGTGKTTIIKAVLYFNHVNKLTTQLLAPTGRAAKRIQETTGHEAMTIHRCLDIDYKGLGDKAFTYNDPNNYIKKDFVIVDEVSMCDAILTGQLLRKIMAGTKVVFVGDIDQLPSVGAGSVLADIIASGVVPVIRLTEIYRQSEASTIATNARLINIGEMPVLDNKSCDFFYEYANTPAEIKQKVLGLATERLPKYLYKRSDVSCEQSENRYKRSDVSCEQSENRYKRSDVSCEQSENRKTDAGKIQVLSAMKMGEAGVISLNNTLQNAVNPPKPDTAEYEFHNMTFRVGDRVMNTANNYSQEWTKGTETGKGIFNGDIGIITEINRDSGEIVVELEDGRITVYLRSDLPNLTLSYAITVHKSQGCEFDAVILPVVSGAYMILTRNLLYTAVTRAKRLIVLVGTKENIQKMVTNTYTKKRHSALAKFLQHNETEYFGI